MKLIKNDSLQAFTIYFSTEKGAKERWMQPGESLVVPSSYITEQLRTLQRRRMFTIKNA